MRILALTLSFLCIVAIGASGAITGVALVVDPLGNIMTYNTVTRDWDTVITRSRFDGYCILSGPCYSPDGARIAFARYQLNTGASDGSHILIADNTGGNIAELTTTVRTGPTYYGGEADIECSWANNGYIYWSEGGSRVYRAHSTTRAREVVATLDQFTGTPPPRIDNLKVSLNATRAGCMVAGASVGSYGLDFSTWTAHRYGDGCQGTVSPNGQLVTRNTSYVPGYSYHQVAYIHRFDDGSVVDTVVVPGAKPNDTGASPRFTFQRFSHSSNDHITFKGEDLLGGKGYVYRLSTAEAQLIGMCIPYDFWNGLPPQPPATAPFIALDTSVMRFESRNGRAPARVVRVSNAGSAPLGPVTVGTPPSWLSVTITDQTTYQAIAIQPDPTVIPPGLHSVMLVVSGGSAPNAATILISLNVGTSLLAPERLDAYPVSASRVRLDWSMIERGAGTTDVQHKKEQGPWERIALRQAPDSTYTDSTVTPLVVHHYRVRSIVGTDTSGWSNEDSLELGLVKTITVVSPRAGDVFRSGDTVHVQWTSDNVELVEISYSTDGGDTYLLTADSSISRSSHTWGNYPWVLPRLNADSVIVSIREYGNPDVNGVSAAFAFARSGAVLPAAGEAGHGVTVRLSSTGTRTLVRVSGCAGQECTFEVYSLSGKRLFAGSLPPSTASERMAEFPSPACGLLRVRAGGVVRHLQLFPVP